MLPRHPRDLNRRLLLTTAFDVNHHIVKEIQIMHRSERVMVAFAGEMLFRVRGGDDGDVAAEGGFDGLIEVVAVRVGGSVVGRGFQNEIGWKGEERDTRGSGRDRLGRCEGGRAGPLMGWFVWCR